MLLDVKNMAKEYILFWHSAFKRETCINKVDSVAGRLVSGPELAI